MWHFLSDDGRLRDGTAPPADGKWLEHDGPLVMCQSGLHASPRAIDALAYAPGSVVCQVQVGGQVLHGVDKLVCTRRRIIKRADAAPVLRFFARSCALDVVGAWDAPDVVHRWLETGDESLRQAAWYAALDAARAAGYAARAAHAAYAAWNAARSAALGAAARDADDARDAADAARNAALGAAARDADDAAGDAQNVVLESLLIELLGN